MSSQRPDVIRRSKRSPVPTHVSRSSDTDDQRRSECAVELSLLHQGGSLRSPRAARPPAGPALLSPPRSSPAGARAALKACSRLMPEKGYVVAGAVGSAALRSHFGASLEDHGPNVVLYRAGPQTARRAGSLRGHDHSRQSSSSPKPLRRPEPWATRDGARIAARHRVPVVESSRCDHRHGGQVGIEQRAAAPADEAVNLLNAGNTTQHVRSNLYASAATLVAAHQPGARRTPTRHSPPSRPGDASAPLRPNVRPATESTQRAGQVSLSSPTVEAKVQYPRLDEPPWYPPEVGTPQESGQARRHAERSAAARAAKTALPPKDET